MFNNYDKKDDDECVTRCTHFMHFVYFNAKPTASVPIEPSTWHTSHYLIPGGRR